MSKVKVSDQISRPLSDVESAFCGWLAVHSRHLPSRSEARA